MIGNAITTIRIQKEHGGITFNKHGAYLPKKMVREVLDKLHLDITAYHLRYRIGIDKYNKRIYIGFTDKIEMWTGRAVSLKGGGAIINLQLVYKKHLWMKADCSGFSYAKRKVSARAKHYKKYQYVVNLDRKNRI
jgi:hypothetical protein